MVLDWTLTRVQHPNRPVAYRLLSAVCHLVAHRIVHRDIKTDNILLSACADSSTDCKGAPLLVMLGDFGECLDLEQEGFDEFLMDFRNRQTPRGGAPAQVHTCSPYRTARTHTHACMHIYTRTHEYAHAADRFDDLFLFVVHMCKLFILV
jgi:serine/threonine protein kinase